MTVEQIKQYIEANKTPLSIGTVWGTVATVVGSVAVIVIVRKACR